MLAGSVAGLVNCVALQPLDVVKTRMQQSMSPAHHDKHISAHHSGDADARVIRSRATGRPRTTATGFIGTMRVLVRDEGVGALWRGTVGRECMTIYFLS